MKTAEFQKKAIEIVEQQINLLVEMVRLRTPGCEEEKAVRDSISNILTAVAKVAENISYPRVDCCEKLD